MQDSILACFIGNCPIWFKCNISFIQQSYPGQTICFRAFFKAFRPTGTSSLFSLRKEPRYAGWNEGYYELEFGILKPDENGNQVSKFYSFIFFVVQ